MVCRRAKRYCANGLWKRLLVGVRETDKIVGQVILHGGIDCHASDPRSEARSLSFTRVLAKATGNEEFLKMAGIGTENASSAEHNDLLFVALLIAFCETPTDLSATILSSDVDKLFMNSTVDIVPQVSFFKLLCVIKSFMLS